jgi:Cu(I)/Ag(I) efflux system membrane protein CusA/SilA
LVCEICFTDSSGVAEVASFGGFEKQYQLVLDPLKMQYYNVSMMEVMKAVKTR